MNTAMNTVLYVLLGIIGLIVYFIPTYIAVKNRHPSTTGIVLVNILLGFTLIGWVGALIWALTPARKTSQQL